MANPHTAYAASNLLGSAVLTYRDAFDVAQSPATIGTFPLAYIQDSQPGRVFKWRAVELANIRATFSAQVTASIVALVNHNFATDSTHVLESSADALSWSTQATLTPDRTRYYVSFSLASGLYWRLRTTSWGSQAATPYLGELWLGSLTTLTRTHAWGVRKGVSARTTKVQTTYGQRRGSLLSSWERVEGPMASSLTTAELAEMTTFAAAVGYSANQFLFIYDTTDPTCWIANLDLDEYLPSMSSLAQWDAFPLNVSEQPFGAPVA